MTLAKLAVRYNEPMQYTKNKNKLIIKLIKCQENMTFEFIEIQL